MPPKGSAEPVAHAAELERRDAAVAAGLDRVNALAARAGAVRSRASEVREALAELPDELAGVARRRSDAEAARERARSELEDATARLAALESGRRRRGDELDRARSEQETAREALADAEAHVARIDAGEAVLRTHQSALESEGERLVGDARAVACELRGIEGLAQAGIRDPGTTVDDLEEWGAGVRSALFVVRGTLEAQRELVVAEANALGSSVLGEELGASSVAVVHRRIAEQARRTG